MISLVCRKVWGSFKQTKEIIKNFYEKSNLIVICSAINGITDLLIEFYEESCNPQSKCEKILNEIEHIHNALIDNLFDIEGIEYKKCIEFLEQNYSELTQLGQIIRLIRPSLDIKDLIISYGERLSTFIISQLLSKESIYSLYFPSDRLIVISYN
jgi:aspartokinase/homoserine dehydrogenase 1